MFKISNKLSITLSLILCVIVAGVCCGCAVVLPRIVEALCNVHTLLIISAPLIFDVNATAVLVVSYIILGFILLADFIPSIVQEIRYYSTYNFIGERINGYEVDVFYINGVAVAQDPQTGHGGTVAVFIFGTLQSQI